MTPDTRFRADRIEDRNATAINDPILQEDSDTDADESTDDDDTQDDNTISVEESYKRSPALRRLMDTVKDRKNIAQSPSTPTRVQGTTLDWKSHAT